MVVDIKNEFIACCDELPFGILSYSSYIGFNTMEILSLIVEKSQYKILGTKSVKVVEALRKLNMPLFIGFLKILRDNNKIYPSDAILEEELLKYMRLINKIVLKPTIKDEFCKLLSNPIRGYSKDITHMVDYINKGGKITEGPIDQDTRDKFEACCDELPFGIMSCSSYIDLKK